MLATWENYHRLVGGGPFQSSLCNRNKVHPYEIYEKKKKVIELNEFIAKQHHIINELRNKKNENPKSYEENFYEHKLEGAEKLALQASEKLEELKKEIEQYEAEFTINPPSNKEIQIFIDAHGSPTGKKFTLPNNTEVIFHTKKKYKSFIEDFRYTPVKGRTNVGSTYEEETDETKQVPDYNISFGGKGVNNIFIRKYGEKDYTPMNPNSSYRTTLQDIVNHYRRDYSDNKISVYCDFCR